MINEFPLQSTSTVYMSGKSVFNLLRYGQPGIIASVELFPADAEAIRKEFRKALADAVEEGYYIATNGKWGPMEPAENPYKEES